MKRGLVFVALLAGAGPTLAQTPPFQTSVNVVPMDVSVTRGGAPVAGLTARDFIVLDNGSPQEIDSATLETDVPLDVQLVLDTSASVSGNRLKHLVDASSTLVHALHERDRVGLITFSDTLRVENQLTGDFAAVTRSLAKLTGNGTTALRDAVEVAISLRGAGHARPLVILFSDGVDTASWLSYDEIVESARQAGVVIHIVRVPPDPEASALFLENLANATGGRMWNAPHDNELERLFSGALEEMRSRYLLTFSAKSQGKPGWHDLTVKLRNARGDLTARPGYFAGQ
jgi:VWFA-related protein